MSNLQGAPAFRKRLRAIAATKVFTPLGKEWADEAVNIGRQRVGSYRMPYSKGRLLRGIRRKTANQRKAVVVGVAPDSYLVDAGVRPHSLQRRSSRPKGRGKVAAFQRTVFAATARKGHPGFAARPFRQYMADEALRRHPMADELIKAWNEAA